MIVRSGLAFTFPVMFSIGLPDGAVTWRILGPTGLQVASGSVTPGEGAVSVNLPVAAENNTLLPGALSGTRDLVWSYTIGGAVVNGELRYSVEARAPFGASADGVRAKLGVEVSDLPDSDVSLIGAYRKFRGLAGAERLAAETDDEDVLQAVKDAIEAQAALSLIPTMAVRVAVQEDSGTNAYKRQAIDWAAVAESLSGIVGDGITAVFPAYDPLAELGGGLFLLATPANDPFTGGTYT